MRRFVNALASVSTVAGALLVLGAAAPSACAGYGHAPEIDPGYAVNAVALIVAVTFLIVGVGARRGAQSISQ